MLFVVPRCTSICRAAPATGLLVTSPTGPRSLYPPLPRPVPSTRCTSDGVYREPDRYNSAIFGGNFGRLRSLRSPGWEWCRRVPNPRRWRGALSPDTRVHVSGSRPDGCLLTRWRYTIGSLLHTAVVVWTIAWFFEHESIPPGRGVASNQSARDAPGTVNFPGGVDVPSRRYAEE